MSTEFSELRTSVQLFSVKHDDLLKQIKQSKEKLHQQRTDLSKTNFKVNNIKKDLRSTEERITNACFEIEELGCTLEGTVWKYRESRRRVTVKPNPLFNQLTKLLMFQLQTRYFYCAPYTVLQCCCSTKNNCEIYPVRLCLGVRACETHQ